MSKIWLAVCLLISNIVAVNAQQFSINILNPVYVGQTQTNWCWAACNQMLLNAKGINETQENQVIKLFGEKVNQGAGANYELAKRALAGTYTTESGQRAIVQPYVSYLSQRNSTDPIVIINHINAGIPLVMATSQHGRVCIGVDYNQNGNQYQITKMRLYNPLNPNGVEEFTMIDFLRQGLLGFMTYDIRLEKN